MDLLLIPILLSIGGGLIYVSLNGAPKVSLEQLPFNFKRDPFRLNDWMIKRPATNRGRGNRITTEDAELVELMNDMIAVREELTDLRLARAPRPIRRRQGRKAAAPTVVAAPVVTVEVSVAVEEPAPAPVVRKAEAIAPVVETPAVKEATAKESVSKLPHPVKAATEMPAVPKELLKQTTTKVVAKKPAAEKAPLEAEKPAATRRPSYSGNRRYVRT